MMSTQCSKHVEAYNKLIIKGDFFALSWLIAKIMLRLKTETKYLTLNLAKYEYFTMYWS